MENLSEYDDAMGFELRGVVCRGPAVDFAGWPPEGLCALSVVDCRIEGELRVPPRCCYVRATRSSIGRLVVDGPDVAGVSACDCAVDELVLGGEALEYVDVVRCGLRRVTASARLARLRGLDLSHNALEAYDVAADATPRLRRLELQHNALGPVPVRLPPSLDELYVAGNPALRVAFPDVIFRKRRSGGSGGSGCDGCFWCDDVGPDCMTGGDCVEVIGGDCVRARCDVLADLYSELVERDGGCEPWMDVPSFVEAAIRRANDRHHAARKGASPL